MVICVQGDHLLSVLHEMCAHRNLASYTPAVGDMSRVETAFSGIGMQEQWAMQMACIDMLNGAWHEPTRAGPETRTTRPYGLVVITMVGAPRFELGTSRTRTVRSTGLSHAPNIPVVLKSRQDYTRRVCFVQAGRLALTAREPAAGCKGRPGPGSRCRPGRGRGGPPFP